MALRAAPSIKIMGKNLAGRLAFIVAVLVVFCFGIVGVPRGGIVESIKRNINLGLDLKGGTHLVLEVHVAEAVGCRPPTAMRPGWKATCRRLGSPERLSARPMRRVRTRSWSRGFRRRS